MYIIYSNLNCKQKQKTSQQLHARDNTYHPRGHWIPFAGWNIQKHNNNEKDGQKEKPTIVFYTKNTLRKQYYDDKNGKIHIKQRIETKILQKYTQCNS